ncbi:methyltransferase domain-containing protein [Haloactinopolyspora sp.]|uniref:class I SAM-dependent methyltransferase n=1 Tax=Haloactinopolyspora sp. TaxID=1966353 RepID=UPI0026212122|nr:methyltransferase domain-containing protein [Haloactinopolyspora sp.]
MADRVRRHPRTEAIWTQLNTAMARLCEVSGRSRLDVVDLGGGSGTFAVPLAELGHRVTVVDPSPNALATLHRRASDAGVDAEVAGVQGDAAGLLSVVGANSADLVLCHGVLEVIDEPDSAMAGVAACLRPAGVCSVVAAQRYAAVFAKAQAGHLADARRLLDDPDGRWGPSDPLPRRFDEPGLISMLTSSGLQVVEVHGVRVFTDGVAGSVGDDPADVAALAELEIAAARHPAFRAVAAALHVIARRNPA